MATDYLGLFASQHNFKYHKNMIYGIYNGYHVCLCLRGGFTAFYFNTQITEISSFNSILQGESGNYGIVSYKMSPPILAVIARGEGDNLTRLLDFLTQLLRMCKATSSETCSFCGMRLKQEERLYFSVDDVVCVGHESCFVSYDNKINKGAQDYLAALKPWYKVMHAPLFAAVICAILTVLAITYFRLDPVVAYFAGALLTGYFVSLFYARKGGKWGAQGYALCIVLTALAVFLSQMFYRSYDIMVEHGLTLRGAIALYFSSYLQPSLLNLIIPQMVMALALGLFGIFICVTRAKRNSARARVKIHKI